MISASGSNPLERYSKCTLILQVIQLMNDPGPEALADPTLIMLREPHLGGTGGRLAYSGTETQETACGPRAARSSPWRHCNALGKVSLLQKLCGVRAGTHLQSTCYGRANGCHQFKTFSTDKPLLSFSDSTRANYFKTLLQDDDASNRTISTLCNCAPLFGWSSEMFAEKRTEGKVLHHSNINSLKIAH